MGWGWAGGGGRVGEGKKENLNWMIFILLKPHTTVKISNVGFPQHLYRRFCVKMKYLMENYSQPFSQSILNSATFDEASTSLIALQIK